MEVPSARRRRRSMSMRMRTSRRRVRSRAGRSGQCRVALQQRLRQGAFAAAAVAVALSSSGLGSDHRRTIFEAGLPVCDAWSDYPVIAERTAPRNVPRCYSVCPPPVFPNGPDPFYGSAYALYVAVAFVCATNKYSECRVLCMSVNCPCSAHRPGLRWSCSGGVAPCLLILK